MQVLLIRPQKSNPELVTVDVSAPFDFNAVKRGIQGLIFSENDSGKELNKLTLQELQDYKVHGSSFALYCKDLFDYRVDAFNEMATAVHCCVEMKGPRLDISKHGFMIGCCVIAPVALQNKAEVGGGGVTMELWDQICAIIARKKK
jgi:hypothetical protein